MLPPGCAHRALLRSAIHGMAATLLKPGDAVVAISSFGRAIDPLRTVELVRGNGADVVGITASGSPLAKLCTVTPLADVDEDPDVYSPVTSRIAHLVLVDVLAVGLALQRGPALLEPIGKDQTYSAREASPRLCVGQPDSGVRQQSQPSAKRSAPVQRQQISACENAVQSMRWPMPLSPLLQNHNRVTGLLCLNTKYLAWQNHLWQHWAVGVAHSRELRPNGNSY
jgi:hypothetical protein